jgi:hypothetical protein
MHDALSPLLTVHHVCGIHTSSFIMRVKYRPCIVYTASCYMGCSQVPRRRNVEAFCIHTYMIYFSVRVTVLPNNNAAVVYF